MTKNSVLELASKSAHVTVNLTNLIDLGDSTRTRLDADLAFDLTHAIEKALEA